MENQGLGKLYRDGEVIVREGDSGDCMYIVQDGRVEVLRGTDGGKVRLAVLGPHDVFGEMALFEKEKRCATVRAVGEARILTVDRKSFLRRVHEDPSLAFRILQMMSRRIREADAEIARSSSGRARPSEAPRSATVRRDH
jgi:CRP/FNR family transcriptional regulator, cyclic AMP receptor protein